MKRPHPVDGLPLRCMHGATLCWWCHYHRLQAHLRLKHPQPERMSR